MDREKVIKGLEICSEHGSWHGLNCEDNEACKNCPYRRCETGCVVTIAKDALALLKEQEPKPVELHTNAYGTKFYFCPKCKRELFHTRNLNFCERCGQAVKWND